MNAKKAQEIKSIASKVDALGQSIGVTHILDIGGGQGYLSSVLALEYNYHVVVVDADPKQILGGIKRFNNIKTLYHKRHRNPTGSVNFCQRKIEINQDYDQIIFEMETEYGLSNCNWMIIGLHCCGDLSVSMIKGFCGRKRTDIKALFSIGCCYQLLSEKVDNDLIGFPMSKNPRISSLGICRKMVACQPPYRMSNVDYFEESIRRLFYRAVLQKILVDYNLPMNPLET